MKLNSSSKSKKPSTYVFIDAENIRNAAEQCGYIDLDYEKIYLWLKKKREVSRIFIYAAIEQGDITKEQRYSRLNKSDCVVNLKSVVAYKQPVWLLSTTCPHCKQQFIRRTYIKDRKKANCDADMTLDLVKYACGDDYDNAIVFSGDGDFAKVYEYLTNERGKKILVFAPLDKHSRITNTKIKGLAKNKVIGLADLGGILIHYGLKTIIAP